MQGVSLEVSLEEAITRNTQVSKTAKVQQYTIVVSIFFSIIPI